jgi:hypothetical protein
VEERKTGRLEAWKSGSLEERDALMPRLQPTGLRNLRAFQLAKKLSHEVYEISADFPNHEYRLIGQMRGAAVFVLGNIAEGYGRNAIGDYIRYL